ncbi:alpha/beta fold hydrolase [Myxococcus eversor]|uniref:alpha/beta fold hydrolase n=1 Tax=Myxococcus eversor TaxID=2709661 RepID=UPI0013D7995D|nr:alpha/beta fold hydrolase [Myxococcus eversor]
MRTVADCVVTPHPRNEQKAPGGFLIHVASRGPLTEQAVIEHIRATCPPQVGPLHVVLVHAIPPSRQFLSREDSGLAVLDDTLVDTCQRVVDGLLGSGQFQVSVADAGHTPEALRLRRAPADAPTSDTLTDPAASMARGHSAAAPARLAIADGGPARSGAEQTLTDVLLAAVERSPEQRIIHVEADGVERTDTYRDLLSRALRVAGGLRSAGLRPGQAVLFQLPGTRDFITALWGTLLAGLVPAPVATPAEYAEGIPGVSKLLAAWQALHEPCILTDSSRLASLHAFAANNGHTVTAASVDDLIRHEPVAPYRDASPDDVTLLLFTSGSTGTPKTVPLRHQSILTEARGSAWVKRTGPEDVSFSWMPLEHGGSIAMMHMGNLLSSCTEVHVPMQRILGEPLRWLGWMERHGATLSWAPHFAFGLIVGELGRQKSARRWDLSRVRILINGGEAISSRTAREFLRALAPHGLRDTAMWPAWGMSETSSGVTYSTEFNLSTTSDDDAVVSLGQPIPGVRLRIVDDTDRVLPEGEVGSLEIQGPSVLRGYVDNDAANRESFTADGWFRTGDRAFLREGRLTLTGRTRDTIIINGANHFGHEIEATVEELPFIDRSYTAACAVRPNGASTDQLALFFHLLPGTNEQEASRRIRAAVARGHGVNPDHLVAVDREDIPKTDLGKIQRTLLASRYAAKLASAEPRADANHRLPAWFYRRAWHAAPLDADPHGEERSATVLLIEGDPHLGEALRQELDGREQPHVTVVPASTPGLVRESPRVYRLDTENPSHLLQFLTELREAGLLPRHILHLAAPSPVGVPESFEAQREACLRACGWLVPLLRALDASRPEQVLLRVIATHGQRVLADDPVAVHHAPVRGLLATAQLELPWLRASHLDLPPGAPDANARRILSEVDALCVEPGVAWRDDGRHVLRMEPTHPGGALIDAPGFERGGLFVLTGGLGHLGRLVAEWLVTRYDARVLLLGRTPEASLHEASRTALASLREQGEVLYRSLDVGDSDAVRLAVEHAEARWSRPVDRMLHLAGTYEEKPLLEMTREDLANALAPKLAGAWSLWRLVKHRPGCRLILFSSAVGAVGGALQGAHSACNAALDAFAEQCHAESRHAALPPACHSIGWSYWRGERTADLEVTGQAVARGHALMEPAQALESLPIAAASSDAVSWVGVLPGGHHLRSRLAGPPRAVRRVFARGPAPSLDAARGALARIRVVDVSGLPVAMTVAETTDIIAPATNTTDSVRRVRRLFAEVLGQPDIGADDDFFDAGGNSIQLARLHRALETDLQREVRWADVLRCRTANAIARLLTGEEATETKYLTFQGIRYAYRVVPGPEQPLIDSPLLIISGAFQDMYALPKLEHLLHPLGTLIMADLPGSGAADDLSSELGFDFLADCLEHLRVHLGVPRLNVMGISYGGSTAYEFAHRYPESVDRLVLVGAALELPRDSAARVDVRAEQILEGQLDAFVQGLVRATMNQDPRNHVREAEATRVLVEKAFYAVTPREANRYGAVQNRLIAKARDPRLHILDRPTLVFTGEFDPLTPPEHVRNLAETIPGALFTTIREADHLVLMERPEEMADLVSRFLQDHDLFQLDYISAIECPTSRNGDEVETVPLESSRKDFHDGASA